MNPIPTIHDIYRARPHVYTHLSPTPLFHYSGLSRLLDAENFCPKGIMFNYYPVKTVQL